MPPLLRSARHHHYRWATVLLGPARVSRLCGGERDIETSAVGFILPPVATVSTHSVFLFGGDMPVASSFESKNGCAWAVRLYMPNLLDNSTRHHSKGENNEHGVPKSQPPPSVVVVLPALLAAWRGTDRALHGPDARARGAGKREIRHRHQSREAAHHVAETVSPLGFLK